MISSTSHYLKCGLSTTTKSSSSLSTCFRINHRHRRQYHRWMSQNGMMMMMNNLDEKRKETKLKVPKTFIVGQSQRNYTVAAATKWNDNPYNNHNNMMMNTTMIHSIPSYRYMSSDANDDDNSESIVSSIYSDYVADYIPSSKMVWGGTGWLLETLHMDGMVPYSLCFVGTNLIVRTALIPLVIRGAKTAAHLATVAPEIQFLVTLFQRDFAQLRKQQRPLQEQIYLLKITWQTLRQIYKLHKVSPLDVFKSPLLQLPFFWYVSIDIRKIINGANPELAQKLTESPYLFYGMDLTEADPYYGLPILGGALLYLNVEMAMGKRALSGETSSKSNIAMYLKDFFQSLAVLMPCFMAHSPAGVQIYLATSFVFTLGQGMALRNDDIRLMIGLPAMNAPRSAGKLATEFINLKQKEKEAKDARKEHEIIHGEHGVLSPGWESSFVGTQRPSTITIDMMNDSNTMNTNTNSDVVMKDISTSKEIENETSKWMKTQHPSLSVSPNAKAQPTPLLITSPEDDKKIKEEKLKEKEVMEEPQYMAQISEKIMEAANRGERIDPEPQIVKPKISSTESSKSINTKQFVKSNTKKKKKKRKANPKKTRK